MHKQGLLKRLLLVGALGASTLGVALGAAAADVVKIGVLAPLSGPSASDGSDFVKGVELAVEERNAKGGVAGYTFEIVSADVKDGSPDNVSSAAQRLINTDGVEVVLTGFASLSLFEVDLFADANMPYISSGPSGSFSGIVAKDPDNYTCCWSLSPSYAGYETDVLPLVDGLVADGKFKLTAGKKLAMISSDNPYSKVNGGEYTTFQTRLADTLQSVKKIDDDTVAFTLKEPLAPFIGIMAHQSLAITSAEYADAMSKAGTPEQFDRQPIGTGAFQLQDYQADTAVRLIPFANTWGAAIGDESRTPKVDAVVMAISTDATVRLQRAMVDECQIALYPNRADRETIEKSGNLNLVRTPVASTGFITFNFNDDALKNKKVREALAHAIDIKPLVDVVYDGMGKATGSLIPPALWGFDEKIAPYDYDPQEAKALLKEAGYPDGFSTQIWAVPVSRPYMPHGRRAAEMIQADWAKIGVKAEIVSYEWAEYIKRSVSGESKVGMFGGIWDFPDPSEIPNNYFTCDSSGKPSPSNIGGWCNKDFNALMNQAGAITDQPQREKLYKQAEQVFHDEVPAVILGSADAITAVSKKVKGYKEANFGTSRLAGVTVEE